MTYRSTLSVIPCRLNPSDTSEMVTQLLYGETFEILEKQEKWLLIKIIHDNYTCFIDKKQFDEAQLVKDQNIDSNLQTMKSPFAQLDIDSKSSLLFAGSQIANQDNQEPLSLKEYAYQYLNTPYLWGGRTIAGIDCSGYTQLICRLLGINIPRDAYQQAEIGTPVSFITETQTGDLAFFDNKEGRITHVGIIIDEDGDKKIIHASGKVRIDNIDHYGIFNAEQKNYTHQLRVIKRVVQ